MKDKGQGGRDRRGRREIWFIPSIIEEEGWGGVGGRRKAGGDG